MTPNQLTVITDLTVPFNGIKESCEAGITPSLYILGTKIIVKFDVRTTHKGTRRAIGTYYNYEDAVAAKWGYKRDKIIKEAQRSSDAIMIAKESINREGMIMKVDSAQQSISQEINKELLNDLLSSIPPHEILAESVIEVLSTIPEEADRGIKYRISPHQQSQWLQSLYSAEPESGNKNYSEDSI